MTLQVVGGDLLRQLIAARYASNLTQATVAEKMGVSAARVGHIESGYRTMTMGTLLRYAEAVGVDLVAVQKSPPMCQLGGV